MKWSFKKNERMAPWLWSNSWWSVNIIWPVNWLACQACTIFKGMSSNLSHLPDPKICDEKGAALWRVINFLVYFFMAVPCAVRKGKTMLGLVCLLLPFCHLKFLYNGYHHGISNVFNTDLAIMRNVFKIVPHVFIKRTWYRRKLTKPSHFPSVVCRVSMGTNKMVIRMKVI